MTLLEVSSAPSELSYWGGDNCQVCKPPRPLPCPAGHAFDLSSCKCTEHCPANLECLNGGALLRTGCICSCAGGWTGADCSLPADGSTRERAGVSCKSILDTFPASVSGKYWINPTQKGTSSQAFEVTCDMDTDGGGWITLARVGDTLKSRPITAQTYFDGVSPENSGDSAAEFILPCANLNGIAGKNGKTLTQFILRVSMGKVRDYFKPSKPDGTSLCHMLMHDNSHVWSPDADGMASSLSDAAAKAIAGIGWITPMYSQVGPQLGLLGGSNLSWPLGIDGRTYLSLWGAKDAPGGCCHGGSRLYPMAAGTAFVDAPSWGRSFELHILELPPLISPEELVAAEDSVANPGSGASSPSSVRKINERAAQEALATSSEAQQQAAAARKREAADGAADLAGLSELLD